MEEGTKEKESQSEHVVGEGVTGGRRSTVRGAVEARGSHSGAEAGLSRRLPEASLVSGAAPPALAPRGAGRGRGRGRKSAQPGGPTGVSDATAFPSRLFEQVREKMPGLPGRHFWG